MQNVRCGDKMKNRKVSNKWQKISLIAFGMGVLGTLSFNCSPALFESKKGGSSGSLELLSVFEETNAPITLLTAEQTYQSMLNVTGQTATPVARAEYTSRFGAMSSTQSLTNVNSPLLLASTSLAGDVCNSAITAEMSTANPRRLFGSINFAAAPDLVAFQGSAAAMAEAFWGRRINGEELAQINLFYEEMTTGVTANAALTRALALGACSAMLSSFDSLVH
jgi:hypothetical protein